MSRRLAAATLLSLTLASSSTSAQIFLADPPSRGVWSFDVGAQMADPIGDFKTQVNRAWGFGGSVRHHFGWFQPFGVRGDFSFLNYGNERKRVPLSTTVNRVMVDMRTTNNIGVLSAGPELMVPSGPLRPYVYAFAGVSYFYTQSSADDDNGGGSFASTTNFSDAGLTTGGGGGLKIPLQTRRVDVAIDAGARLTRNGVRQYLVRGDIQDQPDGSLVFTPRMTTADFWQYHLGVSFTPRRRR
jgi:hypothetical protein